MVVGSGYILYRLPQRVSVYTLTHRVAPLVEPARSTYPQRQNLPSQALAVLVSIPRFAARASLVIPPYRATRRVAAKTFCHCTLASYNPMLYKAIANIMFVGVILYTIR